MSSIRFQHQDDHHQYHHQQQQRSIKINKEYQINGARPTPLQLHKNSHVIHKSSSAASSSCSSISTACSSTTTTSPNRHNNQRNGPVIIYTRSPKVIHTQPRDFMALVQKLTGQSSVKQTHQRVMAPPPRPVINSVDERDVDVEGTGSGVAQDLNLDYGLSTGKFDSNNERRILSEIPLFTPTGMDMFRSPQAQQQQFRFAGDSIFSPATLEFLKPLSEF